MKPESQRIAIAEACGYGGIELAHNGFQFWASKHPEGTTIVVPDYLNDLNACHEMEKVLTREQRLDYVDNLHFFTCQGEQRRDVEVTMSTAAQRCEAFLRTLNLWTDDE